MNFSSQGVRLGAQGYFEVDGQRLVPVGVNYWPGSCGVEMWQRWPEDEIRRDLDLLPDLGLNCVRFFLRWQDFEPEAGRYEDVMFERLARMLEWCRERGIYAHPSLFVGWMSGGTFWPKWRAGRNTFADPFMVERSTAFARRAAQVIAPFHASVLAVDQGNELCCLVDSPQASPGAVEAWCGAVNLAIRSVYPQALIVSGNEQNQVDHDTGWRFGSQPGTDFYSMHGYPVPGWHQVGFDGMTDPFMQGLLPTYVQVARAYGPVMLQEFGTIATFGVHQQDTYLRGMLPQAWEAGANGFLWWCLRDIRAGVHPYTSNGFEGTLGLVDGRGRVKPGLEYFLEFARSLPGRPAPDFSAIDTGIYLPEWYYPREMPEGLPNQPRLLARGVSIARHLLKRLGIQARMVRGGEPADERIRTLVIPGALISPREAAALHAWVAQGGRLIWHGPDPVNWGPDYIELLGAVPVDYRPARELRVAAFGEEWVMADFPRDMYIEVEPRGARVLASDPEGRPALLERAVGQGKVIFTLASVEESVARVAANRAARDRWAGFYNGILKQFTEV
jgi:hypothetical protein